MRERLLNAGFAENNNEPADIYIVNTCTVTAQADRESRRLIRRALRLNSRAKVIVTGCYIQKDARETLKISSKVLIVPNQQKHRIVDYLNSAGEKRPLTGDESFIPLGISGFKDYQRAFVKIQDGCNNFCSYCKVPLVRGGSRSRGLKEIIEEVRRLVNCGFKEIVLTGICLGDYHYRNFDLANVVTSLEKIKGEFRIRLSSIEPQLINDRLIKTFNSPKICPHLHIPLQSGDDTILKMMNRQYTQKEFLSLIAKIKKRIKDVAITTDILVGFPGEKEINFKQTLSCLKEILPLRTHIFSFSLREGTRAFMLKEQIEPGLIKERVNRLKEVSAECSYKFRKQFLEKTLSVLIEAKVDRKSRAFCGYSQNYIRVILEDATEKDINNLTEVKVKAVDIYSTRAQKFRPKKDGGF